MAAALLPSDYRDTLRMFHAEELTGEVYFLELCQKEVDPETRLKLERLAEIETANKAWLRGLVLHCGLSAPEPVEAVEEGLRLAANYRGVWTDYMRVFRDRLATIHIPRFRSYLDQANARGIPVEIAACRLMVEHDEAYHEFAVRDLAGNNLANVLEPLDGVVRVPLDELA